MEAKSEHAPTLDRGHYKRNKKTAWLEFLEALKAWLWAHKDGQTRWTLELDDALRRASPLHPSTTVAGLAKQILHQSILKNALVRSFQALHPDLISMHPNTDAQDASGNIVAFGTKLLATLANEFSPHDAEGVSQATLELQRALENFPGNARGIGALNGWCQRVQILFNDLARISAGDINQHICAQLDRLLIRFDGENKEALKWYRLKDKVHALPEYIAAPKAVLYLAKIRRFAQDFVDAEKLGKAHKDNDRKHGKGGKHLTSVFSASALCWICGGSGHDVKQCKMLETALRDYRSKHLHKGPGSSSKPKHGHQAARGPQDGKKFNNGARPSRFTYKPQQNKHFKHKSRGPNANNAVHFAVSSIADLPPPQPEDAHHFAFHAACPPCAGHEISDEAWKEKLSAEACMKRTAALQDAAERERADALEYTLEHAAALERASLVVIDVVGDIQAAVVNYEEVYPGKRRRLTGPALASPDKEPHVDISDKKPHDDIICDSPEEEDLGPLIESSDSSDEESVAQAIIARGICGKDALTVSFDSDSSSDDDYASAKTEQAAAAKAANKYKDNTEQEKLFGYYLRTALYSKTGDSDEPLQLAPGLNIFDQLIDLYPSPTAIIEVCIGPKNELKEIQMPMPRACLH